MLFFGEECWRKMKGRNISEAKSLLRAMENRYTNACSRFLLSDSSNDFSSNPVWLLRKKNEPPSCLLINSRSTIMPVLNGRKEIPEPHFLKSFKRRKKIHSVQGLKEEVLIFEKEMDKIGMAIADIFDYDLMTLDTQANLKNFFSPPSALVLRTPTMIDIDALTVLQAAYEQEEVIPKGSVFSPAASRVNLTNIISRGHILAAELNGRLVGKINISGVSFTRYQVGGVYVHPDFRGRGIARRMASEFISSLVKQGRGINLFVKKSNLPARRLYAGLGFTLAGDYRITYY